LTHTVYSVTLSYVRRQGGQNHHSAIRQRAADIELFIVQPTWHVSLIYIPVNTVWSLVIPHVIIIPIPFPPCTFISFMMTSVWVY